MATVYAPIAKDESINTTESPSRNIADVLAQELSGIASAITGGSDKVPKADIATVEPSNTASRAYSVGELVYVNGNLYKVITAIASGATFTVGTNIQSTNVSSICRGGWYVGSYEGITATDAKDFVLRAARYLNSKMEVGESIVKGFAWSGYNYFVCYAVKDAYVITGGMNSPFATYANLSFTYVPSSDAVTVCATAGTQL